ncbi:MAG: hypothetical protein ABIP29_12255, partial [Candidatus Eisenbacteria bacterium]
CMRRLLAALLMVGLSGLFTPSAAASACCGVQETCCQAEAGDCPAAVGCADDPVAKLVSVELPATELALSLSPAARLATSSPIKAVPRAFVRTSRLPRYLLLGSLRI